MTTIQLSKKLLLQRYNLESIKDLSIIHIAEFVGKALINVSENSAKHITEIRLDRYVKRSVPKIFEGDIPVNSFPLDALEDDCKISIIAGVIVEHTGGIYGPHPSVIKKIEIREDNHYILL